MRLTRALGVLGLCGLLGGREAAASEALKVGLASAGGELAGMIVGGGAGLAAGAAMCEISRSWECWLPLATMPMGGTVGGIIGGTAGAGLGARKQGADLRRVRRWTLAAGLGGLGVGALGMAVDSSALFLVGAAGGAVGMPVLAGLAADRPSAEADAAQPERRVQVMLSPTVDLSRSGQHRIGLSLDGRF